jgi:hypothetical protein
VITNLSIILFSLSPIKWLEQHPNNEYAVSECFPSHLTLPDGRPKPRAAIVSLVRNQELERMRQHETNGVLVEQEIPVSMGLL